MYECAICQSVNHAKRMHCRHCGVIPANYSVTGKPCVIVEHENFTQFREAVAAHGCVRSAQHYQAKFRLQTAIRADYYAF